MLEYSSRPSDKEGVRSSWPRDRGRGGGRSWKIFFRPFGPQFGPKIRGGRPLPWIRHWFGRLIVHSIEQQADVGFSRKSILFARYGRSYQSTLHVTWNGWRQDGCEWRSIIRANLQNWWIIQLTGNFKLLTELKISKGFQNPNTLFQNHTSAIFQY